ncbi:MAG: CreA family protein [Methyloceanibacter sp.]
MRAKRTLAPAMAIVLAGVALLLATPGTARADDMECVSTTFRMLSPSDKVCLSVFDDPKVPGVTCYISQARTGGWGQPLGLNEDPSNFSVSCRQMGPISVDLKTLPDREEAFTEKTSIFFKKTRIYRIPDVSRNALIYLAISAKLIEGSPANSVSSVPIMPWPAKQ